MDLDSVDIRATIFVEAHKILKKRLKREKGPKFEETLTLAAWLLQDVEFSGAPAQKHPFGFHGGSDLITDINLGEDGDSGFEDEEEDDE